MGELNPDSAQRGKTKVKILVVHYSQTGQLTRVLRSLLGPLQANEEARIDWRELRPMAPYAFPWRFLAFFDVLPESVYQDPPPIESCGIAPDAQYDLIIVGYQVWFLSPSLPIVAFLKSPEAKVLRGRPVITVVGCRNMWVTAQQAMSGLLRDLGARLVDNVVLTDEGPIWATFITTPWWLLTGNKGPLMGILPEAGISASSIKRSERFGHALNASLGHGMAGDGPFLRGLQAAKVRPLTLLAERIAYRSFRIWGRILRSVGKPGSAARKPVLAIYIVFLVAMILVVLPFTATILAIKARFSRKVQDEATALELPSGSGTERMALYDHSPSSRVPEDAPA
jgi:hypothetical protein